MAIILAFHPNGHTVAVLSIASIDKHTSHSLVIINELINRLITILAISCLNYCHFEIALCRNKFYFK